MANKPSKKAKRRLVNSSETFRERAVKANTEKPKRQPIKSSRSFVAHKLKPLIRPFRQLSQKKGFRVIAVPLRLIGKVIVPVYFRNSFKELKLVTWPGWKQSRRLTYAVLVFAVIFGAAIAGVDWGLDKIFKNLLLK